MTPTLRPLSCTDWRDEPYSVIEPLYAGESARWAAALDWDLKPSWEVVESARHAGRLPGLVARQADGRISGWAYFLLHQDVLQIGALVARSAATVRRLLDGVLTSPEASLARGVTCFVFPGSNAVGSALVRRRFEVRRQLYLRRPLEAGDPMERAGSHSPEPVLLPWEAIDVAAAARLLARAYAGEPAARLFAPNGQLGEWAHYLGQLLRVPACGRFLPGASYFVADPQLGEPIALVLTTTLGGRAAHIAQVAVDPGNRRRGLARALVAGACRAARAAGHAQITLLVDEGNAAARRLYHAAGFEEGPAFLFGIRRSPLRRTMRSESTARSQPLSSLINPRLTARIDD